MTIVRSPGQATTPDLGGFGSWDYSKLMGRTTYTHTPILLNGHQGASCILHASRTHMNSPATTAFPARRTISSLFRLAKAIVYLCVHLEGRSLEKNAYSSNATPDISAPLRRRQCGSFPRFASLVRSKWARITFSHRNKSKKKGKYEG